MLLTYPPHWTNPFASWQMKLDRAAEHVAALKAELSEYRAKDPVKVVADEAPVDNLLAYRLQYRKPVPPRIKVILADALNNLRVATENLAFELARLSVSGVLTEGQESASTFPICPSPEDFEKFFTTRNRRGLYNDHAIEAFRLVQPFAKLEWMQLAGVEPPPSPEEYLKWHELHRLNRVWNIDKHRRQAGLMWWPDLIYWGSNGQSKRQLHIGDRSLEAGSVLFYIEGEDEGMGRNVHCEFNLCFTDDPAFAGAEGGREEVGALVEGWLGHIRDYVFPVIYSVMSRPGPAPSADPTLAINVNR